MAACFPSEWVGRLPLPAAVLLWFCCLPAVLSMLLLFVPCALRDVLIVAERFDRHLRTWRQGAAELPPCRKAATLHDFIRLIQIHHVALPTHHRASQQQHTNTKKHTNHAALRAEARFPRGRIR